MVISSSSDSGMSEFVGGVSFAKVGHGLKKRWYGVRRCPQRAHGFPVQTLSAMALFRYASCFIAGLVLDFQIWWQVLGMFSCPWSINLC